jgi:hypothetical protein
MQNGPNKYGGQLALPANNDALQGILILFNKMIKFNIKNHTLLNLVISN